MWLPPIACVCGRHFWSCRRCKCPPHPMTVYPGLYMQRTHSWSAGQAAGTFFQRVWTSVCGHNGVRAPLLVLPPVQITSLPLDSLPGALDEVTAALISWRSSRDQFWLSMEAAYGRPELRAGALLVLPPLQIISLPLDSLPRALYGPNTDPGR
jgi:hypothetical protein